LEWKKGQRGGWRVKGHCDDFEDEHDFITHAASIRLIQKVLAAPPAVNEAVEILSEEVAEDSDKERDWGE
jgi:hypothetical protein